MLVSLCFISAAGLMITANVADIAESDVLVNYGLVYGPAKAIAGVFGGLLAATLYAAFATWTSGRRCHAGPSRPGGRAWGSSSMQWEWLSFLYTVNLGANGE